jgi:hypothetical protein
VQATKQNWLNLIFEVQIWEIKILKLESFPHTGRNSPATEFVALLMTMGRSLMEETRSFHTHLAR